MARATGKNTGKKTTQAKAAPKRVAANNAKVTKTTKTTSKATPTKATAKKVATKPTQKGGDVEESPATRYYKLITIDQNENGEDVAVCRGRYSGKKPRQASSKGCTKLFRAYKDRDEEYPESIIFGMHECTRSRKKKKKFFYIGTKEDLDEPQEVPIHQKGDDGKYLLDESGNKVPKLDPNTGDPLVIRYRTNSKVKKLFCPERREKVEADGERRTVVRALTEEEYGELENSPYTFNEYLAIHAKFDLLRNYDAPDDEEDEEAQAAPAPKKTARATKATKATKTAKATKATKATKSTSAPKKTTANATKAPVVNKNTSNNITVKKNASKGKKAAPKKAAPKKAGRKTAAKKN